jgi:hypothetical protein
VACSVGVNAAAIKKLVAGRWRIVETEGWDRKTLDLVERAFLYFEEGEPTGAFAMIAIRGGVHYCVSERYGKPLVEWTWQGLDEGRDELCGRGWATLEPDGKLRGRIFIHRGDDSSFVAKRFADTKRRSREARGR